MSAFRTIALLVLMATTMAAQCPGTRKRARPAAKAAKAIDELPPGAEQRIDGMRVVLTNQGVSRGVLLSDIAYTYDQSQGGRLELERVNFTFFDSQGGPDGVLTSQQGTYSPNLQRLEVRGDVIINRIDGRRLTTPKLVYDQLRNQVMSDTTFTLAEPTRQISGIGFESDPRLTLFRCLRACKAIAPVTIPGR